MESDFKRADEISRAHYDFTHYPRTSRAEIAGKVVELRVWKNVFDPAYALSTKYLIMHLEEAQYSFGRCFDMGCGCGIIAIALAMLGISEHVDAYDLNGNAVRNARYNISNKCKLRDVVTVYEANYFRLHGELPFSAQIYHGGVFNHPYVPESISQKIWQNQDASGGEDSIREFFAVLPKYMLPGAPIVMPFSTVVGEQHDPARIALELGADVRTVKTFKDGRGAHLIYEIRF